MTAPRGGGIHAGSARRSGAGTGATDSSDHVGVHNEPVSRHDEAFPPWRHSPIGHRMTCARHGAGWSSPSCKRAAFTLALGQPGAASADLDVRAAEPDVACRAVHGTERANSVLTPGVICVRPVKKWRRRRILSATKMTGNRLIIDMPGHTARGSPRGAYPALRTGQRLKHQRIASPPSTWRPGPATRSQGSPPAAAASPHAADPGRSDRSTTCGCWPSSTPPSPTPGTD